MKANLQNNLEWLKTQIHLYKVINQIKEEESCTMKVVSYSYEKLPKVEIQIKPKLLTFYRDIREIRFSDELSFFSKEDIDLIIKLHKKFLKSKVGNGYEKSIPKKIKEIFFDFRKKEHYVKLGSMEEKVEIKSCKKMFSEIREVVDSPTKNMIDMAYYAGIDKVSED